MPTEKYVKDRIKLSFPDSVIEVQDYTGTGDHFDVYVESEKFVGLSRVEQHKLVYKSLEGDIGDHSVHALKLTTKLPSEVE